jgi:hypothetical protein
MRYKMKKLLLTSLIAASFVPAIATANQMTHERNVPTVCTVQIGTDGSQIALDGENNIAKNTFEITSNANINGNIKYALEVVSFNSELKETLTKYTAPNVGVEFVLTDKTSTDRVISISEGDTLNANNMKAKSGHEVSIGARLTGVPANLVQAGEIKITTIVTTSCAKANQ